MTIRRLIQGPVTEYRGREEFAWLPVRLTDGCWAWLRKVTHMKKEFGCGPKHKYTDNRIDSERAASSIAGVVRWP